MRATFYLLLTTLLLTALPVRAQTLPVANAPTPSADFLRSGGAEPDTTAPWRYYPLGVGDAWEYEVQDRFGNDTGDTRRLHIERDSVAANGRRYSLLTFSLFRADGAVFVFGSVPLHYDTLGARVFELHPKGFEQSYSGAPCRFDADFGSTAKCYGPSDSYFVTGGYGGALDFEPDTTVTGLSVKTYEGSADLVRYVASFGEVLYVEVKGEDVYVLEACRVGGVEYGRRQFPVAAEPSAPEGPEAALALEVWPNPSGARATVAFTLARPGAVRLRVVDALGREVLRQEAGVLGAGRREVALDGRGLVPGLYVVEVLTEEGRVGSTRLLRAL